MELFSDLYVSDEVENIGEVVYSLKNNLPMDGLYCLMLCEGSRMEIISTRELFKGRFRTTNGMVVGVAYGKKRAKLLFCQIIAEGMNPLDMGKWFEGENK